MKIVFLVEGETEKVFIPYLRKFLETKLTGRMPKLVPLIYHGRIPKGEKLKRVVGVAFSGKKAADYVIALTDVYTGTNPPDFINAADAKVKMSAWVGNEPRFIPHAAQHDFEAWLLPFWSTIQGLAHHNMACPGNNPETVNHQKPPAYWIKEIFEKGKVRDSYIKPRDAKRILDDNQDNFINAVNSCAELKALINSIFTICGEEPIP